MFETAGDSAGEPVDTDSGWLLRPNEILRGCERRRTIEARAAWKRFNDAAMLHRLLVEPTTGTEAEVRALDPFTQCAARISAAEGITQRTAELQINRGLALRDRIPAVNALLKAGWVAAEHIPEIVSRTELIDTSEHRAEIDAAIAAALSRHGSWSKSRMRDMVDAIIFRRDPDLVRRARDEAKNNRGVWASATEHGMAVLDTQMVAEDIVLIMTRLEKVGDVDL